MNKEVKNLIWVFLGLTVAKIVLNSFVKSPSSFADAYFYTLSAKALVALEWGVFFQNYPPLYPLLISWVYLFNDFQLSYFLIKITNSIISSLIIFPAYFLAREYLKDEKISFYTALIIGLFPSNFSYSAFILSENLFNLLFLTTVYILYLIFVKSKNNLIVLSSFFIFLCYITRAISIVIFPAVIIYSIIEKKYKEGIYIILFSLVLLAPYIFIKGSLLTGYGVEVDRIYEGHVNLIETIFWVLLYPFFLYLQGFVIFTNSALKTIKWDKTTKLFLIFILFFVGIAAYHAIAGINGLFGMISGRPIGRYTAAILPLIVILGIENLRKFKVSYYLAIPFAVLMLYPLLLPNNIDSSWLGWTYLLFGNQSLITQLVLYLLISIVIIYLINHFRKYINIKRIVMALFVANLVIFGGIIYNSNHYYSQRDDSLAGIYLNKLSPDAIIAIDPSECVETFTKKSDTLCDKDNHMSIMGIWNRNVVVGENIDADYIVSKKELNLKKIKSFGEINIYET